MCLTLIHHSKRMKIVSVFYHLLNNFFSNHDGFIKFVVFLNFFLVSWQITSKEVSILKGNFLKKNDWVDMWEWSLKIQTYFFCRHYFLYKMFEGKKFQFLKWRKFVKFLSCYWVSKATVKCVKRNSKEFFNRFDSLI